MTFWSRVDWLHTTPGNRPVEPWNHQQIDEAADYRLTIGPEVYLAESGASSITRLSEEEGFCIQPGQFAYILTEERMNLSLNVIGFISVRAKIKFHGLVNVSGFHVDPGYRGRLVFAVFNSGPTRINLRRGDDIFSLWLAELKSPATKYKTGYEKLDSDLINKLDGKHASAYQLSERIHKLESRLTQITTIALIAAVVWIYPAARDFISKPAAPSTTSQQTEQSENAEQPSNNLQQATE